MAKSDVFLNALRLAGYRVTDQRRRVCEYLAETNTHPTPYQVYEGISARYPDISRATIYNTLNVLRQLGAIVEIGMSSDHTHYDTNPSPHINLICLRCHTISDFPTSFPLERLGLMLDQIDGFQPVTARVDLLGFCRECQTRKRLEIQDEWRRRNAPAAQVSNQSPVEGRGTTPAPIPLTPDAVDTAANTEGEGASDGEFPGSQ